MTREERLDLLKQIEKDIHVCSIESTFLDDAKSCAIHSAIEELEQEPCDDCIDMESEKIKILQKRAYLEGFHEASKMLVKQEPLTDVLDKIRADVEHIEVSGRIDEHSSFIRSGEHIKNMVIDIIDKNKTDMLK